MAITTYPLDGVDFSAQDVETYLSTRSSGVFHEVDNFDIAVTGARKVTVSSGLAWMRVKRFSGKSVCVDDPVELTIDAADSTLSRIDRIVLRYDATLNASVMAVKKGTASSNPTAPGVQRDSLMHELGLYTVLVPAGSVSVSEGDITDTRGDSSVCGRMSDGVSVNGTNATFNLVGTTLYINTTT